MNLLYDAIRIIAQESLIAVFFISLMKTKRSAVITLLICIGALSAVIIPLYVATRLSTWIKTAIITIVAIAGSYTISNDTLKDKTVIAGFFLVCVTLAEVASIALCNALAHLLDKEMLSIAQTSFFCIFFLCLFMLFSLFWKRISGAIMHKITATIFIYAVAQITILCGIFVRRTSAGSRTALLEIACLLSITAAGYLMYKTIKQAAQSQDTLHEIETLKMQQNMQYDYYELVSKSSEEMSILRHEINNQLQTAYAILSKPDSHEEALRFLTLIEQKVSDVAQTKYCDNQVINAVLALKTMAAKNNGISVDIMIENISSIVIADIDLCSIFTNMYDNALEASLKCSQDSRRISIRAGERNGYLVIKFSNYYDGSVTTKKDGTIATSKKDPHKHGYGLRLLKAIAEKYEGELMFNTKPNIFEVVITLKINLKIS